MPKAGWRAQKHAIAEPVNGQWVPPRGMAVKTLPEDRLIRKAVVQGIGRLLRDVYDQDAVGPVPDHIAQLLARLDTVKPSGTRETRVR